MSYVMNYNNLVSNVENYLERMDQIVTDEMDTWIKFAHERIGRDCNTLLFEQYITQNFTPGLAVIQKPSRIQNTITFNYGTNIGSAMTFNVRAPITLRTYEFARAYWPDQTQVAAPRFYSDYGYNNWLITPTPDQAYPFEIAYLETPQVIDESYQTNYLTEFMPEILLKAVLLEAMITLKNDERIGPIESDYVKLISSWNNKDTLIKTDRFATREAD